MTNLFENWNSRDDKKLAPKPISMRLPVHVVARLHALYELHPDRIKNDMLIDLMKAGLDAFEQALPAFTYEEQFVEDDEGRTHNFKVPTGYKADFHQAANKHYKKLQEELGNHKYTPLYDTAAKEVK